MNDFSADEIDGYTYMQARMVELLLRHDQGRFQQYYSARTAFDAEPEADRLHRYRELGVLFHLRAELFEHILPQIIRRLSFEAPRSLSSEEPPAQGRVDWDRSLDATWAERPGEPPLVLQTRQRRRTFATPENLLVVVTLLEFQASAHRLLWDEQTAVGAASLRHPLNEIADQCERELQFPQFAGLRQASQRIIDGEDGGPDALEQRVQERLAPGSNPAYQALLEWRRRLHALQLLRRTTTNAVDDVLGADPAFDNYLYQLWIFYELADMLAGDGRLIALDTTPKKMRMTFRWGKGNDERSYELRHDQKVPESVAAWTLKTGKGIVPGVRPDFYLHRVDPPPQRIEHNGTLYWREPGVVWDAKYYRQREEKHAPSTPVKRMVADLQLLGEQHGVLLFAFLKSPPKQVSVAIDETQSSDDEVESVASGDYALIPDPGHDQTLAQEQEVWVRTLSPTGKTDGALRGVLSRLLGDVHRWIQVPCVPACHGTFLDTQSAESGQLIPSVLVDRYGKKINASKSELLLCPKPHIGPWRVDLVSRTMHCCKDPKLCQIISQPNAHKPVRPVRDAKAMVEEIHQLFEGNTEVSDDQLRDIEHHVAVLTRQLADALGATQHMEIYYGHLRAYGMRRTLHLLPQEAQESLALAIFLVEQLDKVGAKDFSGPAIQIARVVEGEVVDRVLRNVQLVLEYPGQKPTLGTLTFLVMNQGDRQGNWQRIADHAAKHWTSQFLGAQREVLFVDFAKALNDIKKLRNRAAHPHRFERDAYDEMQALTYEQSPLGIGVLNALLLGWQE